MNVIKDVTMGTVNAGKGIVSKGIDGAKEMAFGSIKGIMNWTAGSIWALLKGTGKAALKAAASLPILPAPRK